MKANTAVCLMLAAVSCILINDRSPSHGKRVVIQLFAATIGLIPGMPVMFCIEHRPELTRWAAAVMAAAAFIGGILSLLDWMIVPA